MQENLIKLTKDNTIKIVENSNTVFRYFEYQDFELYEHTEFKGSCNANTINHHNKEVEYTVNNIKTIISVDKKRVYTELDIMKIIRARKNKKKGKNPLSRCLGCKLDKCDKECFKKMIG